MLKRNPHRRFLRGNKITTTSLLIFFGFCLIFTSSRMTTASGDLTTENVIWTNAFNATANGNNLSKTVYSYSWDAGAISSQSIPYGDGYVEFTTPELNTHRMCGLSNGDTNQYYSDVDFAIYPAANGWFYVYEAGVYRNQFGPYAAGDRFRVAVENGVITYRRNGEIFYTSTVAPTYPLVADTSLYSYGANINDTVIARQDENFYSASGQASSIAAQPPEPPRAYVNTAYPVNTGGTIHRPMNGTELATVLADDNLRLGDTIELQAGVTYRGSFSLRKVTQGSGWIVIRTSNMSGIPVEGNRVEPSSHAVAMPKIEAIGNASQTSTSTDKPAFITEAGAHHYRLVGLEVRLAPEVQKHLGLIVLGKGLETDTGELPSDIIIDRCYIHGKNNTHLKRGITLNAKRSAVIDSYISEIIGNHFETNGIMVWNTPGPLKIINNRIEASGENLLFGGAEPGITDINVIPSDIEIRRNHLYKPTSWRGVWLVKNLLELKSARRVVIDGNRLEYSWDSGDVCQTDLDTGAVLTGTRRNCGQGGGAVLFTVRNQTGKTPWNTIEDVAFTNNEVAHAAGAISFLGNDDEYPSQQAKRILVRNNLFKDISASPQGWGRTGEIGNLFKIVSGRLRDEFGQVLSGTSSLQITQNTAINDGRIIWAGVTDDRGTFGTMPDFVFTDNIVAHNSNADQNGGITGQSVGIGDVALNAYFPGAVFERNVLVGGNGSQYQSHNSSGEGNAFPATWNEVGFVNFSGGDYHLSPSSQYRGRGADIAKIEAAINATSPTPSAIQFTASGYAGKESPEPVYTGIATLTVERTGSTVNGATVEYKTSDAAGLTACTTHTGAASQRCDYMMKAGTLNFGAGETSKTITILIIDDAHPEGNEMFTVTLSNATGGNLGAANTATVTVQDNDVATSANPIDGVGFFVTQQYLDFLSRRPDGTGYNNWTNTLGNCPGGGFGNNHPNCDRVHVSEGFFKSTEFLNRGYWAYRFYQVSFGRSPLYAEFIPDMVRVGGEQSLQQEARSKEAFVDDWVQKDEFKARYNGLSNSAYVNALLQTAGVTVSNQGALIQALDTRKKSRAQVLREIVESQAVDDKFYNPAFVSMQYFGYLRRDPDPTGYSNWLNDLNQNPNNSRPMIFGFIYSTEYRGRFGQP